MHSHPIRPRRQIFRLPTRHRSCHCLSPLHDQYWCLHLRHRVRACRRLKETSRAIQYRRYSVGQLLYRAGSKSPRPHWCRCLHSRAEPGSRLHPVAPQDLRPDDPNRRHLLPSLHQEQVAAERYCWPATCRPGPAPPPVLPVPPPLPASVGGGGTTLGTPTIGAEDAAPERVPVPPDIPAEGGGATTFDPIELPIPFRAPRGLPPAGLAATLGGGGTMFVAREVPLPPVGPFE